MGIGSHLLIMCLIIPVVVPTLKEDEKTPTQRKVHVVKIIANYLGAQKFGQERHKPIKKPIHVDKKNYNNDDVHKEGVDIHVDQQESLAPLTATTHLSDFETKEDNITTTQPSLNTLSVPQNSENNPVKTSDLSHVSFINFKTKENDETEVEENNSTKSEEESDNIREIKSILTEVTDYGLKEMKRLYDVVEPELYRKGIYLEDGSPGTYLAAFNFQAKGVKKFASYGYAALKASKKLKHELSLSKMREEVFNLTEDNTKKFPKISLLDTSLHDQCPIRFSPQCPSWAHLYRTADGTCNNRNSPWWGSIFQPLKRYLHPHYHDGLEEVRRSVEGFPLPSPREISTMVHWDRHVEATSVTHLFTQWGQFLDHDLTSSSQSGGFNGSVPRCCDVRPQDLHPECLPIQVHPDDRFYSNFGIQCLEFLRSLPATRAGCGLGPREQLNQVTSYLDGSMIYGTTDRDASELRLFRNGMLKYTRMPQRLPLLPSDPRRGEACRGRNDNLNCFMSGDGRVTEQPGLITMHILFLRLHNRLTRNLAHLNPHWSDERLYQETRRIVGAILQHVTYREYLPVLLGPAVLEMFDINLLSQGYYEGYDMKTSANAANSFTSAAFRFGHSMVQGRYQRWDSRSDTLFSNVSLHRELDDSRMMHSFGAVDSLVMGMCGQASQKRDQHLTMELTNHLFETPRFPAGLDLAAINIQRGRDHGMPSYNQWRNPCGLRRMTKWEDLKNVMSEDVVQQLRRVYRHYEDIDLYTGGLSELPVQGGLVGSTFACIIAQFFSHLRKGDRFWYENGNQPNSFTQLQLQHIRRVTLSRILCDNLDLSDKIQPFAFLMADNVRNQRVSCQSNSIPFIDLFPWKESFNGKWHQNSNKKPSEPASLPEVPFLVREESNCTQEVPTPIKIDPDLEL